VRARHLFQVLATLLSEGDPVLGQRNPLLATHERSVGSERREKSFHDFILQMQHLAELIRGDCGPLRRLLVKLSDRLEDTVEDLPATALQFHVAAGVVFQPLPHLLDR